METEGAGATFPSLPGSQTERWIADVVITEAVSGEGLERTRSLEGLTGYRSLSLMADGKRKADQPWDQTAPNGSRAGFALMMMLMREAGQSAKGQMEEV